jgi:hypothetical protein
VNSTSPFKGKLDAALAINNNLQKDAALAAVAKEAAVGGDAEVTKAALHKISNNLTRDQAACECAVKLAKGGKSAEGTEVAKTIDNNLMRDATLSKLATGQFGE